jgi:hypothetical protein
MAKYDYRSETFDIAKPFNIDGTVWKVTDRHRWQIQADHQRRVARISPSS